MNVFSDISIYWVLPIGLISFLVAFLFYLKQRQVDGMKKGVKWLLVFLRGTSLFLIVLLLLGVIIERKVSRNEKPVFITLIDNSSSMLNYKDSALVKNKIDDFQQKVTKKFKDKFEFETILIGGDVKSSAEFNFNENQSNLDEGFDYIYNSFYNKNIGAIAFFSDGNFNEGMSPVYSSKKINFTPIFTIGIGDTIVKKDQLIRNVSYNSIAFYKNEFPIEIDIEGRKIGKRNATVSLWKDGKKIDQTSIEYKDGEIDFVHVSFSLLASSIGFSELIVKVEGLEGESSFKNNEKRFYVETIDSRNKILLLSYSPHPDISAIKNELEKDENAEVESMLFSDFSGKVNAYSLIIIQNPNNEIMPIIIEAKSAKIPLLYLLGTQTQKGSVDELNIGLKFPSGNRSDEVQAAINSSFQLFDVSEELKTSLSQWPPLTVKFGEIRTSNGSVLLQQKIGSVVKKDPILFFGTRNQYKYGVIVGEGLWKWKVNDYLAHGNTNRFNELIQKTVHYLTVKKNNDPLRISLPNRFSIHKDIIVNAEFYNSSFEKITTPKLEFNILNTKGEEFNYEFAKINGGYQLNVGQLNEGKYSWTAKTKYNGVNHVKKGVFIVEDASIESLSTHSNFTVLNLISTNSQAHFVYLDEANSLLKEIENRKDIVRISYKESSFDDLIDWKYLFAFIVLLLIAEWFIRRYSGGY